MATKPNPTEHEPDSSAGWREWTAWSDAKMDRRARAAGRRWQILSWLLALAGLALAVAVVAGWLPLD